MGRKVEKEPSRGLSCCDCRNWLLYLLVLLSLSLSILIFWIYLYLSQNLRIQVEELEKSRNSTVRELVRDQLAELDAKFLANKLLA